MASAPVGLLVAAILHGNEWRDISEDNRPGIRTLSARGRRQGRPPVLRLPAGRRLRRARPRGRRSACPPLALLALLSLPLLVRALRTGRLGAAGQQRAIAMIDLETARLHTLFGVLLLAGLISARLLS